MTGPVLSRRSLLAAAGAAAAASSVGLRTAAAAGPVVLRNPLVRQRADAQVFRHSDGRYYLTGSVPEYDRVVLRRADTLAGLRTAREVVLWRRPAQGPLGGYVWAPEVHRFDGAWHAYFAAGDSDDPFHIRTYVLRNPSGDPFTGTWTLLGQLQTPWDTFTLDSTTFVHRGTRYLAWAQNEPGIETNSNLYLAPLATPTTLAAPPARLSVPTLDWEVRGFKVNEAPALLQRSGRVFMTYSASATDARYCMGLLTADDDADLMDPASWSKAQEPVFATSVATGVFGPGHNSFTVDEQGRDLLVYHGRNYRDIDGDPLFDPNRHTRVQRLYYREDGTPEFGIPVGNGPLPDRFTPLSQPGRYLRHDGDRVLVGRTSPVQASQYRLEPGAAAGGVLFQAINRPGRYLRRTGDGTVVLSARDGSSAFAEQAAFRPEPGLAGSGTSYAAQGRPGAYLQADGSDVRVGPVVSRAAATFRLS